MKQFILIIIGLLFVINTNAQRYITKSGHINFFSETPVEDIKADNFKVSSILDVKTGEMVFKVPMQSFDFEKKLMQEHFNENYVESEKFPEAIFKGKITNLSDVDFQNEGRYKALIEGEMTIHGVTKKINVEGQFDVTGGKVYGKSNFFISPADYDIEIPKLVQNKIAKNILVNVDMIYEEMN